MGKAQGEEMEPLRGGSEGRSWKLVLAWGFGVIGILALLFAFCLADSLFSWGIMPDSVERFANRILVRFIP